MKLSAKKMGSMKTVKDSLKKGGSGGNFKTYIKNVPADGITVRFLTEPEEWFGYQEYWDDTAKTFVPMVEGEILPDGSRPSFRYLANVLDVDNDRVIPLKLAKTAANVLILKYDKYDTMMDRNYELQKHGEGLDTTYDVTPDAPSKLNLAKYDLLDLEQVLIDARTEATGEVADSSDAEPVRASKSSRKTVVTSGSANAGSAVIEDEEVEEDEIEVSVSDSDDEEMDVDVLFPEAEFRTDYTQEELEYIANSLQDDFVQLLEWWELDPDLDNKKAFKAIIEKQKEYNFDDGDEESDSDDSEAEDSDGEEEVEYDEDALRGMTIRELRLIAEDLEIDFDKGATKNTLVDLIIEAAEA